MATYGPATTPPNSYADDAKRERALSLVAGLLGILMFIWGFLKWLNTGDSSNHDQKTKYAGYAFGMPTTAVIALSLAAGLIAVLGATDRRAGRGVPSAVPTGLAATSFLIALGILLGKGSISPGVGSNVGVEIGLILGLVTAAVQTLVLAMGLAKRKHDAVDTGYASAGYGDAYTTSPGAVR